MKYPISEIFGPTIQGEGPLLGVKTYFVRFRGCDWDCSWCDTKYAVLPRYPGWDQALGPMTTEEIEAQLVGLGVRPGDWITLSGGNPALFVDVPFCEDLKKFGGYKLAIETQGSREMPARVVSYFLDSLIVSPKPPSSGMDKKNDPHIVEELFRYRLRTSSYVNALKYVVFDQVDLEWIHTFDSALSESATFDIPRYLSVGTPLDAGIAVQDLPAPSTDPLTNVRNQICDQMAWLFDVVSNEKRFANFRVTPQSHTLAWGQKRGK